MLISVDISVSLFFLLLLLKAETMRTCGLREYSLSWNDKVN